MKKLFALLPGNKRKPVWGQPLSTVARSFGIDDVPIPIVHAIEFLNNKGLRVEGVYRVPGNLRIVDLLKKRYDAGETPDLTEYDAYVISGLVKNYFSSLPDPLMTYELYDSFLSAQALRDRDQRLKSVQALIQSPLMPPENRKTLARLVAHLRIVADNAEHNKMSLANLSIVFGPTLFRSVDDNPIKIMTDTPLLTGLVQCLIVEQQFIFNDKKPETEAPAIIMSMPTPNPPPQQPSQPQQQTETPPTQSATSEKAPEIDYDNVNEEELQASLMSRFGAANLTENTAGNRKGRNTSVANVANTAPAPATVSALGPASTTAASGPVPSTEESTLHRPDDDVNMMIREIIGDALRSGTRFSIEFDMLDQGRLEQRKRQSLEQAKRLEQEFGPSSSISIATSTSTPSSSVTASKSASSAPRAASSTTTATDSLLASASLEQADSDRRKRRQYSSIATEAGSHASASSLESGGSTKADSAATTDALQSVAVDDEKTYLKWLSDNYPLNIADPLPNVQQRIALRRTREGRPDDIAKMTLEELKEEKSLIKKELRNFDKMFEENRGQEPAKRDKEPLREVYKRYKLLKSLIASPQRGGTKVPMSARHHSKTQSATSQRISPQTAR